jgi:hypothetical protein
MVLEKDRKRTLLGRAKSEAIDRIAAHGTIAGIFSSSAR